MKTLLNAMLFDMSMQRPEMVQHLIQEADDGTVEHSTDGKLRATIPPGHFQDYLDTENLSNVKREMQLNALAEKASRAPLKRVYSTIPVSKKRNR